jgi:hypothetical protein
MKAASLDAMPAADQVEKGYAGFFDVKKGD